MSNLHAAIMNLPCKYEAAWQTLAPSDWIEGYVNGHRDTRHAAAELAAAHEARLAEVLEALARMCRNFPTDSDMAEAGWTAREISDACDAYDAAQALVRQHKEQA
jgi:hypothetical protein